MAMATVDDVLKALSACQDPELHKDIVSLGMIRNVDVAGSRVSFDYVLTTPACPLKGMMEEEARSAVLKLPGVSDVSIRMTGQVKKDARLEGVLPPGIKNVVAVGSGKGGVGKSTVAANLAVGLARDGAAVGLMDADIYGPNQPQMLGVPEWKLGPAEDERIAPAESFGIKLMSMGFLMEPDKAAIWRGPMLHGAITQFLKDVKWGELDYLIVDLPPGTGDVQLSLCQSVPLAGAVVVTTPQSVATADVTRAVAMFVKLQVPVLGVVENMGLFACPHCGQESSIFSSGGAEQLAKKYGVPLLGGIPLDPQICESGESGKPVILSHPDSKPALAFRDVARKVAARVSVLGEGHKAAPVPMASPR